MTWKDEMTKKGQRLPPPLPMYETVKLKHVPTMVRRRYDRDLNIIDNANEGLSSEDGKSEAGDGIEDDDYSNDAIDVDDNVDNNEGEDDTQANFEHKSQSYREDVGDIKSQDDNDHVVHLSSNVDASVEDDIQDLGDMNDHDSYSKKDCEDEDKDQDEDEAEDVDVVRSVHDNEEGSNSKVQNDEDEGPKDTTLTDYVDDSVKNKIQYNEQGSHEKDYIKSEDDGTIDGNVANCYGNGSVQDEVQDNQIGNFVNEQGLPEKDDRHKGDETGDVIHDAAGPDSDNHVEDEADDAQANFHTKFDTQTHITENFDAVDSFGSTASSYSEERKFEDEIEHTIRANSAEASVVEDCIQDHEHEKSDIIDLGSSCSKDFEEDNVVNNVKPTLASYVDTSVKDGVQHHEQVLKVEDRKSEGGETRDVNGASYKEGESVKIQETIDNKREIFDIKQGICQAQLSSFSSTPRLARRLIQVNWDPPPIGFYKLNFDGLSNSSPKMGIIIRDSHGSILSAQVFKTGPITPFVAQVWALQCGILQANHLDRSNLCTEGDNRLVIRLISCNYQCPWNLQFAVEDFKHPLNQFYYLQNSPH